MFGDDDGASPRYLFNAKELDEETGLYYYGARYYDPRTSVFLSIDPLAEKYPGWSSFSYAFNNPIRFLDPTGMEGEDGVDPSKNWYLNLKEGKIELLESSDSRFDEGYVQLANEDATTEDISKSLSDKNYSHQKDNNVEGGFRVDTQKQYKGWQMMQKGEGYIWIAGGEALGALLEFYGLAKTVYSEIKLAKEITKEANLAKGAVQAEMKFNQQQIWKKFGEHYKELGLPHSKEGMQQYLGMAREVFKNPTIKHTFPQGGRYAGETWLMNNGKLLRLDSQGNFRSLYMIK